MSPALIWRLEGETDAEVREALLFNHRRHPEITALFCTDRVAVIATKVFDVPRELSVVGLGGLPETLNSRPPVTTLAPSDPDCLARWTCMEMISHLQTLAAGRPIPPPTEAFFSLDLVLRASTRAIAERKVEANLAVLPPPNPNPRETWRKVYPFAKRTKSTDWLQVDLSGIVNHSITRHHGWLGAEPLEHFPPGLRLIHGVPFQVLDENRHNGHAVLTFRSPQTHSAGRAVLPVRAKIKVDSRVRAIYFLHGCGHASPSPFARYIMRYRRGGFSTVVLAPVGSSWRAAQQRLTTPANLQDWWPAWEQMDFPHAYQLIVFNPANPTAYQRWLYSLEWINPRPKDEVSFIEVRVDPKAGPTLALIAVTALVNE